MLFAVLVPNPHALALDDDPGFGIFKRFMLRQVVPDMGAVGLDHLGNVIVAKCAVHDMSPHVGARGYVFDS